MKFLFTACRYTIVWLVVASISSHLQPSSPNTGDWSDAQKEAFLASAKVVKSQSIGIGINNTMRLTLSDDQTTHDAHHNVVDIRKPRYETPLGVEFNFRDSYLFNIAAYRLDRLVNLNMVPVSVERKIGRDRGAVTWWVDDVQMLERDRLQKKVAPPDQADWTDQMFQVRVFNELVFNTDANLGNLIITGDWKIRLIDFTRAFRQQKSLRSPQNLIRIDRRVYEGLKNLNEDTLSEELKPVLGKAEIRAVLARREKILSLFDKKIAERGEEAVICDKPGH
jgi:hypothetical protein